MTPIALSFSLLWMAIITAPAVAQLEEVLEGLGGLFGGDDDTGNSSSTLEDIFGVVEDLVGGAIESLNISSLPDELAELFALPTFENFTFSFGGNCTICDEEESLEGVFEDVDCNEWEVVSFLGIPIGSDQCNLLRVAAVERCGCPVPAENQGKTCPVCPEGQAPGPASDALEDVLGVSCADLKAAPAVDGDSTCASVSTLTSRCQCVPMDQAGGDSSTGTSVPGGESTTPSGAGSKISQLSLLFVVVGAVLGVAL